MIEAGSWVVLTYRYDDCVKTTIEKLVVEEKNRYIFDSSVRGRNSAPKDRATLKLWEPKAGEWCWFWDGQDRPVLSKFVKHYKVAGYISEGDWYQKDNTGWMHCEPFIGSLPNHLKGK